MSPVREHSGESIQVAAGGSALADAIAHAPSGARLCLQPGDHVASLTLSKSIVLVGSEGAARTVVRGSGRGAVLRVDDDGLSIRLEGLTITGGVADAGGGLAVHGRGKVQVSDCAFRGNKAGMVGGGGIYAREGLLSVERTTFEGNEARQGGAAYLDRVVKAEIARCSFQDNDAESGGALRVTEGAEAEVKASTFAGNRASTGDHAALHVTGTRSRKPRLELNHCDVQDGGLVNGPENPGDIRLKNSKVPAAWRSVAGVTDEGGSTFRNP